MEEEEVKPAEGNPCEDFRQRQAEDLRLPTPCFGAPGVPLSQETGCHKLSDALDPCAAGVDVVNHPFAITHSSVDEDAVRSVSDRKSVV